MKKFFVLFILFSASIASLAQTQKQTIDYIESLYKQSYNNLGLRITKVELVNNIMVITYSTGGAFKKEILRDDKLVLKKDSSDKYYVSFKNAKEYVFGYLQSIDDAKQLKNSLEYLINIIKSESGIALTTRNTSSLPQFKNEKLALVQHIFHNTSRNNIVSYMKAKGYGEPEIAKGDATSGETLYFESKFVMIDVEYQKNNTVASVTCTYSGSINNAFIESELKDKGFKPTVQKLSTDNGRKFDAKTWTISNFKNCFRTAALEEDKVGMLYYAKSEG